MKFIIRAMIFVVLASMVFGQTYLINETFTTVPPSGWTNYGTVQGTSAQDGDSKSLEIDGSDSIITIAATDPDRVSFWYARNSNATRGDVSIEYREGAVGAWNPLVTVTPSSLSYVQSNSELPALSGDVYFKIIGAVTSKEIVIDVFQVTQSIVVSTASLSGFSYEPSNGPSTEQSFTVSGANLTNDITLTPPTNYEISTGTGGGFSATNPITLTQSGGTVNATTIYVRLKAGLSEASYNNETITISSTGKISKTVTCSGDVRTSLSVSADSLTNFNYDPGSGPSAEQSFTVSGQDLTNNISITPPTNYEISTGTGAGFTATNPITLTQSGGTVNATTIYVRLKSGLSQGTYNNEDITVSSTGKVSKTVTCSGFVGPLMLNIKVFIEGSLW